MRLPFVLLALWLGTGPGAAQDTRAVEALLSDSLAALGGGAVLVVVDADTVRYRAAFGDAALGEIVPLGTTTAWLSGAVLAALDDDETLDLDAPLARFFPDTEGDKRGVTVRQLAAHVSGFPTGVGVDGPSCLADPTTTLPACADAIVALDLVAEPGVAFAHGDASLHLAARMAELQTGLRWTVLFGDYLAGPLGLVGTTYESSRNPGIARGALGTADDLGAFLSMLLAGGLSDGERVLSAGAVGELLADQTGGAAFVATPYGPVLEAYPERAPSEVIRYGLGVWREDLRPDGTLRVASALSGTGVAPWLDQDVGLGGVLVTRATMAEVVPTYVALRALVREAFGPTVASAPSPTLPLRLEPPIPNPGRARVTVRYALDAPEAVALSVVDALGRRVTTLADGPRARGEHRSELDVSSLAPGPYLLVLTAGTDRVARPLVVAR
jgi:CubicO group peptidase (beta-lactamase class C family)